MAFSIKVNGNTHSVDVDGDTPLLWVLRDVLGMTSTKFGCGMALCGACTVHIDGAPTRSCEGSAMLRRSPRRTLKAIITQAVALIVALAGSDLKRSVTKRAQPKSIELL